MARTERGSINATQGWKRVRFRTRRTVSRVRWECHGAVVLVGKVGLVIRALGMRSERRS